MATFPTNNHDSVLRQPSPSRKIDQSRIVDYAGVQNETSALYGTVECHETAAFQTLNNNERYEVPDALVDVLRQIGQMSCEPGSRIDAFRSGQMKMMAVLTVCIQAEKDLMDQYSEARWPQSLILSHRVTVEFEAYVLAVPQMVRGTIDHILSYPAPDPFLGIQVIVGIKKRDRPVQKCCMALMAAVHRARKHANMVNCTVHSIFSDGDDHTFYEIDNNSQVSRVLLDWPGREKQTTVDTYSYFRRVIHLAANWARNVL